MLTQIPVKNIYIDFSDNFNWTYSEIDSIISRFTI
jgi:hypothetical protein